MVLLLQALTPQTSSMMMSHIALRLVIMVHALFSIDVHTNIQTLMTILTDVINAGSLSVLASVQVTGIVHVINRLLGWQCSS